MSWIAVHVCVSYCPHWSSVDRKKKKQVRPMEVLQMPVAIIIQNNRSQGKLNTYWVLLTLAYLFEIEHLYLRVWIWTFSLLYVFLICHLPFFFVGCSCTRLTSVTGFYFSANQAANLHKASPLPHRASSSQKKLRYLPSWKSEQKKTQKSQFYFGVSLWCRFWVRFSSCAWKFKIFWYFPS